MEARGIDLTEARAMITPWLKSKMPQASQMSLSNLERSGSGFSNETFLFDVIWNEGGRQKSEGMVLRCPPRSYPIFPEYDLSKQFRVMQLLRRAGIPVPTVYWLEDDRSLLGVPFYVMGKLDGSVPPEYPPYHSFGFYFDATPEQRAKMWWGSLENMARVNRLDWEGLGFSFLGVPGRGTDPVDQRLRYLEDYLNWVKEGPDDSQPILETALGWLKENRYEPERIALCWGDPRLPNTMYDAQYNVMAVLDWEMAYLGDPVADLGWFLFLDWQHCDGYGIPRCDGTPTREETVKRYEELTGWQVRNLFYNEVLAAMYFGVIMLKVFKNFKSMGIAMPGSASEHNNVCTQRLAGLLDLPAPGEPPRPTTRVEDVTVTVQFHLTGPGGCDWYLLCDRGEATRHEGTVANPNCTLTVSAEDWAAIQRGEMERIQAWTSGKLKIDGDMTLLLQLEDLISRFSRQ